MAAVGVAAHGVVAVQPSEGLATAGELIVPGACVHEDLALQCGTHRLSRHIVRAGADFSRGMSHSEDLALDGERLRCVDQSVVSMEDGAYRLPRVTAACRSVSMTRGAPMRSRSAHPTSHRPCARLGDHPVVDPDIHIGGVHEQVGEPGVVQRVGEELTHCLVDVLADP